MARLCFCLTLSAFSLLSCSQDRQPDGVTRQDLRESQFILRDFVATELRLNPVQAILHDLEATLPQQANLTFGDVSQAGLERRRLIRLELLARLRGRPRLPAERQLAQDLEIAAIKLAQLIALEQTGHVDASLAAIDIYSIHPFAGIWLQAPAILTQNHNIDSLADAQAYLIRMSALADALDDLRRRLRADIRTDRGPPSYLIAETARIVAALQAEHRFELETLPAVFRNLIGTVSDITEESEALLNQEATRIFDQEIMPAYANLQAELERQLDAAPEQAGLWARPTGAALYSQLLRFYDAGDITPERLHASTEAAVAQRRRQLIADATVFAQAQLPPQDNTDTGRVDIPRALDIYYARDAAPGGAAAIAADGGKDASPNARYIGFGPAMIFTKHAVGHAPLWPSELAKAARDQVARIGFTTEGLSDARLIMPFTALAHGVPLYQLETEPTRTLAERHILLIESALAHADTGLHYDRWTFSETVSYLKETAYMPDQLARQATFWLITYPALEAAKFQAAQQLRTLAERARAVAGNNYSEAGFLTAVTDNGPRPISFIETDVENWYADLIDQRP